MIRDIYCMPLRVALIKVQQYQLWKFKTKLFPSHGLEYDHMPWQLSVSPNPLEISNLFWISVCVRIGTCSSFLIPPQLLLHKGMSACRSQAFVGTYYFGDVVHLILLLCVSWCIALLSSWFNDSWEMGLSAAGMNLSHMAWRFAVLRSTSLRGPLGVQMVN